MEYYSAMRKDKILYFCCNLDGTGGIQKERIDVHKGLNTP